MSAPIAATVSWILRFKKNELLGSDQWYYITYGDTTPVQVMDQMIRELEKIGYKDANKYLEVL